MSKEKFDKSKDCPDQPSESFERAFMSNCSGCVRHCACGRKLFDGCNSYDWEEGELEGLRANAKVDPDRYVELDYSCSTVTVDGNEWVLGCPCNRLRRYENFIVNHAEQIAIYLNDRSTELERKAAAIKIKAEL